VGVRKKSLLAIRRQRIRLQTGERKALRAAKKVKKEKGLATATKSLTSNKHPT
jgi:hypothetical protein